ncbi:MAG: TonB-dependent receptor [Acidobacteriia bacterium]|nr:TonB-dependent receptor [Terriglobia bacterium]
MNSSARPTWARFHAFIVFLTFFIFASPFRSVSCPAAGDPGVPTPAHSKPALKEITVTGQVKNLDGEFLKGVVISSSQGIKAYSDETGNFSMVFPAAMSQVRFQFELPGYYPETLNFSVADSPAHLEVTLTPIKVVRQEVVVIAPRFDVPLNATPAATSVVGKDVLDQMPRGVALDEALEGVPGVKIDNQANGERVHLSIRGQGILTERGIRGIQVLLDGLPLNDPSGFVPDLFDIDWSGVQEMEVVRGPLGFLYGGGSAGGVIDIRTTDASETLHGNLWASGGANGFYKGHADVSGPFSVGSFYIQASRAAGAGYRQHSAFWADNVYGKFHFNPTSKLNLNVILAGTGFFNQNAEGLNLGQVQFDPRLPNPDALTFNEYQKTVRVATGLTGQWNVSDLQRFSFSFYARRTRYDEPVPSSVVHRTLVSPGGSGQYDLEAGSGMMKHHFSTGFDLDGQFIDEFRHPNLGNAVEGSGFLSNQSITQNRVAAYLTDRIALGSKWSLLFSLRGDRIGNRLDDHLQFRGLNLSGSRIFTRVTGRVGLNWNPNEKLGWYVSWGQGFLPPATEELYANPAALGGFNRSLIPATSQGGEAGMRGSLGNRFYYDATVFRLDTANDFERYRMAGRPLETFYRNAGQSRRYGLETSFRWLPLRRATVTGSYTYSHFVYTQYLSLTYPGNLTGHRLPNSPSHMAFTRASFELPWNVVADVSASVFSRAFIDATNSIWINGYGLLNARLSKSWQRKHVLGTLFVYGKNLTNTSYIAFTEPDPDGNSYQPGPRREIFAGLQLRF